MILDILEYRLKSVKTVFVIFVITNYVRIALAIVTVLQLICVSKKKRYVLKT